MGTWVAARVASHAETANMFVEHPHFTIFPGDRVEVMKCLQKSAM